MTPLTASGPACVTPSWWLPGALPAHSRQGDSGMAGCPKEVQEGDLTEEKGPRKWTGSGPHRAGVGPEAKVAATAKPKTLGMLAG